jgi:hypothetical protein
MTIPLFRDPSEDVRRVTQAPKWLRPMEYGTGLYWHIPRSAHFFDAYRRVHVDRKVNLSIWTWCGQLRFVPVADLTDSEPTGDKCGTCVGRYEGWTGLQGLRFSPRDHWAFPKWCPGSAEAEDDRKCFACGGRTRWHYHSYGGAIEARHHPEPALVDQFTPCPRHGWRDMRTAYDVRRPAGLKCISWQCDWQVCR